MIFTERDDHFINKIICDCEILCSTCEFLGKINLELRRKEKFVIPKEYEGEKDIRKFALSMANNDQDYADEILMDHCDLERLEYYLFGSLNEKGYNFFALR